MSLFGRNDNVFNKAAMMPLTPERVAAYVLDEAPVPLPYLSMNILRDTFSGVRTTFKTEGVDSGLQYLARTTLWSPDPNTFSFGADMVTAFLDGDIVYENGKISKGTGEPMTDCPFVHTTRKRINDKIRNMDGNEI